MGKLLSFFIERRPDAQWFAAGKGNHPGACVPPCDYLKSAGASVWYDWDAEYSRVSPLQG